MLQAGALLEAAFVLAGGILYLVAHPVAATDYRHFFRRTGAVPRTIGGILREARGFHGRALIQLRLLVLIATPVARVLYSVVAFSVYENCKYSVVTLIIAVLLCYSLFGGHG